MSTTLRAFAQDRAPEPPRPSLDTPNVRLRLEAVHPTTMAAIRTRKRCRVCDIFFTDVQNMGTWNCSTHAGAVDAESGRWTCCNRLRHAGGCRRCDHVADGDPAPLGHVTVVPAFIQLAAPPLAEAIVTGRIFPHYRVTSIRHPDDHQQAESERLYSEWEARPGNALFVLHGDSAPLVARPVV